MRLYPVLASILIAYALPAQSATVDGKLVSLDANARILTLESGAELNLGEYVVLDGLEPGQVVRVTYTDGTVDATEVDVLEQVPADPTASSTTTSDTTTDGSAVTVDDGTTPSDSNTDQTNVQTDNSSADQTTSDDQSTQAQ
jgi:hypothetical protein